MLEIWSQLGGHYKRSVHIIISFIFFNFSELVNVVKRIAKQFHKFSMHLILVIPSNKEG